MGQKGGGGGILLIHGTIHNHVCATTAVIQRAM